MQIQPTGGDTSGRRHARVRKVLALVSDKVGNGTEQMMGEQGVRNTSMTAGRARRRRRVPLGHALLHLLTILSLIVSLFGLGVPAALAAPALTFTPPSKDFGPVQIGKTSAVQVFAIQNTSATESVTINDVTALVDNDANGTFTITANSCTLDSGATPVTLAAGQSCQVNVNFTAIQSPFPPESPGDERHALHHF